MKIAIIAVLSLIPTATVRADQPFRLADIRPAPQGDMVAAGVDRIDRPLAEVMLAGDPLSAAAAAGLEVRDTRIAVEVVVAAGAEHRVAGWLEADGATEVAWVEGLVNAFVTPEQLAALDRLDGVRWVRQPPTPVPPRPIAVVGTGELEAMVISEGVAEANADAWHADGYTGESVKVGVIDTQAYGWEDLLGVDLPPADRFQFRRFGAGTSPPDDVHGTGVAEIVYDMAPGVELYLAQVGSGSSNFSSAVQWMIDEGVRVVAMSITYFGVGPGDGTGFFQSRIDDFVTQADGVWAHSAGNYRDSHWQGVSVDVDGNGWVELAPGQEVVPFAFGSSVDDEIRLSMQWNDWTAVDQDYSLHLFLINGDEPIEVDSSDRLQTGVSGQRPTESLSYTVTESGLYGFGVYRKNVTSLNDVEIFSWNDAVENSVEEGSVTTPGDAAGAIATAALSPSGFNLRDFSSAGPANGPGGSFEGGYMKPNLAAYDGVSTASYSGLAYGTSFACPHIAGAAAVVMSAFPGWSGDEVRGFLEERAIDRKAVGPDDDTGWGRVNLGNPPTSNCSYDVEPTFFELDSGTGGAFINVTTDDGCFWSAERQAEWIRLSSDGETGSGRTIGIVQANDGPQRTGTVVVAGVTVTITQQGSDCSYDVAPVEALLPNEGGRGEITVRTSAGCEWTASTVAPFIEIDEPAGGAGSGAVSYSVTANGSDAGRAGEITVAGEVVTVSQPGITEGRRYMVAGVADTSGAAGSDWKTNLALANVLPGAVEITLTYRHDDGEVQRTVDLPAGHAVEFENAAAQLFGVPDSSGAVEVWSIPPVTVTARTFNDTADGTYGQYLPGVEIFDGVFPGQTAVLSQLRSSADFRANVGFVNFGAGVATVEVELYDSSGQPVAGGGFSEFVQPGAWRQRNGVFGATVCEGCSATVSLVSGEGPIWSYASVVDNHSGDPTTIPMEIVSLLPPDGDVLVAGIAETGGAAGTSWRSNLAVMNRSGTPVQGTLWYRHDGGAEAAPISLGDGELVEWENVAAALGAPDSSGAAAVIADGPLIVTARTFNQTQGGTYGQFLPGVASDGAVGEDDTGVLSQIKRTNDFRTNIGFTNFSSSACDARIELYAADGSRIGSDVFVRDIPAGGWMQRNRVFQAAGVVECEIGYAVVSVETPGCEVWAYASVVDNRSGDPTTIPVVIR